MNSMLGKLMADYLKQQLTWLLEFSKTTYAGLLAKLQDDTWTQKDITDAIVKMREHVMNVEVRGEEVQLSLDRCREICENLKGQNVNVSGLETNLDTAKQTWESVLKELQNAIMRVNPLVKAHGIRMKQEIQKYEEHVRAYYGSVQEGAFKVFDTGHEEALELLEKAEEGYAEENGKAEEMVHLANIFECPRDMQKSLEIMTLTKELLTDYKELWELARDVSNFVSLCKESFWQRINPDGMEEVARGFISQLKKLPRSVRDSNAYVGLDKMVKDFIKTCPLIAALRHPAMRDRHWEELMQVTGKYIELPSQNPQLRLDEVLALELHNFSTDVEEITDKALKELKQEEGMESLDKIWSAVQFQMTLYKDTDVPLLKLGDQDFEQLEADQLVVQSMATSRYVFFKAQSLQWQKALGNVAEVMQLLGEIQRVWSYLEPLFVGSEEVKRELPQDAQRFQAVDTQVRTILKQMWATRNVKQACNQPGLFAQLERIQKEQEMCKKSLADFLDGKRRLFPRFYFVSEADLLDILSNGSNPNKVMRHVEKVLLATKSLELRQAEGQRPVAARVSG
jgi:dynein heavy chain, axonemal